MYDGESYIVAKVTKDEYRRYPLLLNKFIVRPAIADLFPDGSGTIFLDQKETFMSKYLEDCFNDPLVKMKISNVNDIFKNFVGTSRANIAFKFLTLDDSFITVSITHENFERKNEELKKCNSSFSELQEKLSIYTGERKR